MDITRQAGIFNGRFDYLRPGPTYVRRAPALGPRWSSRGPDLGLVVVENAGGPPPRVRHHPPLRVRALTCRGRPRPTRRCGEGRAGGGRGAAAAGPLARGRPRRAGPGLWSSPLPARGGGRGRPAAPAGPAGPQRRLDARWLGHGGRPPRWPIRRANYLVRGVLRAFWTPPGGVSGYPVPLSLRLGLGVSLATLVGLLGAWGWRRRGAPRVTNPVTGEGGRISSPRRHTGAGFTDSTPQGLH